MSTSPVSDEALEIASQAVLPALLHLHKESTNGCAEMLASCLSNRDIGDQAARLQISAIVHAHAHSSLLSKDLGHETIRKLFRLMRSEIITQANNMHQRERSSGGDISYPTQRNLHLLSETLLEPRFQNQTIHPELLSYEILNTVASANIDRLNDSFIQQTMASLIAVESMQKENKIALIESCGESNNHKLLRQLIASGLLHFNDCSAEEKAQELHKVMRTSDINGQCQSLVIDALSPQELRHLVELSLAENSSINWRYGTSFFLLSEAALTTFWEDDALRKRIQEGLNKFESEDKHDMARRQIIEDWSSKSSLEALLECASLLGETNHYYARCAIHAMARWEHLSEPADWEPLRSRPAPQEFCQLITANEPTQQKLQALLATPAEYALEAISKYPAEMVQEVIESDPSQLIKSAHKWGSRKTAQILSAILDKAPEASQKIIETISASNPSYYTYTGNDTRSGVFKFIAAAMHCGLLDPQMSQLQSSLKHGYQTIDPAYAAYDLKDPEMLEVLKEGGYDFSQDQTIISAIKDGRKEFITLLFDLGVNPDLKNAKGGTLMQQTKDNSIKELIKSAKAKYAIEQGIGTSQENEQINKKTKKTNISSL